jgi:hypothetical protein
LQVRVLEAHVLLDRSRECGAEVPPDDPGRERQPCPECGALGRNYELDASPGEYCVTGSSVSLRVERAVTETRTTAFALIFATAVGVGLTEPRLKRGDRNRSCLNAGLGPRSVLEIHAGTRPCPGPAPRVKERCAGRLVTPVEVAALAPEGVVGIGKSLRLPLLAGRDEQLARLEMALRLLAAQGVFEPGLLHAPEEVVALQRILTVAVDAGAGVKPGIAPLKLEVLLDDANKGRLFLEAHRHPWSSGRD